MLLVDTICKMYRLSCNLYYYYTDSDMICSTNTLYIYISQRYDNSLPLICCDCTIYVPHHLMIYTVTVHNDKQQCHTLQQLEDYTQCLLQELKLLYPLPLSLWYNYNNIPAFCPENTRQQWQTQNGALKAHLLSFGTRLCLVLLKHFKNYSCQKTLGVHSIDRRHRATSLIIS